MKCKQCQHYIKPEDFGGAKVKLRGVHGGCKIKKGMNIHPENETCADFLWDGKSNKWEGLELWNQ